MKAAENLKDRMPMQGHAENGLYCEVHYEYDGKGRAPSGSSYFYVGPGERTEFHRIDCDEYWCFNAGADLEVWIIDAEGRLELKRFGVSENAEPLVYFPSGAIFGSRSLATDDEGTFFTCITVPRFDYKGFELVSMAKVIEICPDAAGFTE